MDHRSPARWTVFSLGELNQSIQLKLKAYKNRSFQKKAGSRSSLFQEEELPYLAKLPAVPYETAEWKQATVQYNYHISLDQMLYSYIGKKVDVRVTDSMIEVYYKQDRIASHQRLKGRSGQYSTITEHMSPDHQKYLEWDGDHFRKWAASIGSNTAKTVDAILTSKPVEQQSYRTCMALLKLKDKYSAEALELACAEALSFSTNPSYKSVKNILAAASTRDEARKDCSQKLAPQNPYGITRRAKYYGDGSHVE